LHIIRATPPHPHEFKILIGRKPWPLLGSVGGLIQFGTSHTSAPTAMYEILHDYPKPGPDVVMFPFEKSPE